MKLQDYLNKKFLSISKFALKSGVGYKTIERILNGKIRNPLQETKHKIYIATEGEVNLNNYLDK